MCIRDRFYFISCGNYFATRESLTFTTSWEDIFLNECCKNSAERKYSGSIKQGRRCTRAIRALPWLRSPVTLAGKNQEKITFLYRFDWKKIVMKDFMVGRGQVWPEEHLSKPHDPHPWGYFFIVVGTLKNQFFSHISSYINYSQLLINQNLINQKAW